MPKEFRWCALILVGIIILIHFLKIRFPTQAENFILISPKVLERPWTLFTYMFLHGDSSHLFFNMIALAFFGSVLESIIGYKKFLIIFFSAGVVSGIVTTFFYPTIIGASGAIFGVIGALVMIRPMTPVIPIVWIPMPMIFAVILWSVFDLLGIFYPDQIAHYGHLAGLGFGLILGLKLRTKYKLVEKKKAVLTEEELDEWEEKYIRTR